MQWLPLSRRTAQTSLGTTRFFLSIHQPHLSRRIPCSYWALTWVAVLPSCITLYEISVRQTRDLPVVSLFPHPASFRFHLTMDTLAFGYILPTTGRIRDFNPLETCAAGHHCTEIIHSHDFFQYGLYCEQQSLLFTGNVPRARFCEQSSQKNPRGAKSCECMISVHREARYCERSEQ